MNNLNWKDQYTGKAGLTDSQIKGLGEQLNLFHQEKKNIHVIIYCGFEGIEELIFASTNEQEAINKLIELRTAANEIKEESSQYTEDQKDEMLDSEDPETKAKARRILFGKDPDAYCIMSFDGDKFKCSCQELGVAPNKSWLY